jgi:RNA polymerase sigma factor (sigma-70 family)
LENLDIIHFVNKRRLWQTVRKLIIAVRANYIILLRRGGYNVTKRFYPEAGKLMSEVEGNPEFEVVRKTIRGAAWKYANGREDYEDLIQIGHLEALKLLLDCPDGADPIEFVMRHLKYRVRNKARSLWNWKHRVELDADKAEYQMLEDLRTFAEFESVEHWADLERLLADEEVDLLWALREGATQKELALRIGVTPQAVNARVKRIKEKVEKVKSGKVDRDVKDRGGSV